MRKLIILLSLILTSICLKAQTTKIQAQYSIDSLLPSNSGIRISEIRKAFGKVLNYAESTTIDIVKYGANPNGVANTTSIIQAAFATGRKIYVPKGTYLLNDTIQIENNIECEKGAKFKVVSGYQGAVFQIKSKKNISISGLSIEADSTNSNITGLVIQGLWDSVISNYLFYAGSNDTTSIGIDIYSSDPVTMATNPFGAYTINIFNAHSTYGKYGIKAQKSLGDLVAVTHLNIYGGWFSTHTNSAIYLNDCYNFNIINPAFDAIVNRGLKLNNCHQGFFRIGEYNSGVALDISNNCSLVDYETALPNINGMIVGDNYTAKMADRLRLKPSNTGDYYTEFRSENNYSSPFSIVGKPGGGSEITYIYYQADKGLVLKTLSANNSTGSNLIGINADGGLVKRSNRKVIEGTAAPVSGTWNIGDYCENTNPIAGGYMGWVYTATGWKGFGLIQN